MAVQPNLDPRGLKRICMNCGNRFYDLNKRPIVCPACDTEFTGDAKVKSRRSRSAAANDPVESDNTPIEAKDEKEKSVNDDDAPVIEDDDDDVVSFDDLEEDDDMSDDDDDMDLGDDDYGDLDDLEPDADDLDDDDDDRD